jgi:hypothetical protein
VAKKGKATKTPRHEESRRVFSNDLQKMLCAAL